MNKQPDIPPSLLQRLERHWGKIVTAALLSPFLFFLGREICYEIIRQEWRANLLCNDKAFLQIRPGMSHADVFRSFPFTNGYSIFNEVFHKYLSQVLGSGDIKTLVFDALEGNLIALIEGEWATEEEWVIEKQGSEWIQGPEGGHAHIFFDAEGHVVDTDYDKGSGI